MGWFKVDDQLAFHAKIVAAGNSAMGLWVRAGSWSAAQLTDGFIPAHMANVMANAMANPCDADALVMAGLWLEVDGGYQFHDWAGFQPSAADEKARRDEIKAKRSEAGKKGAAARWQEGKPDGKTMANASEPDGKPMAPTRPDPTNEEEANASSSARKRAARASRIPEGWTPSDDLANTMAAECPQVDQRAEHRKFVDYWTAKSGKDATKADWNATYRNWIRRAAEKAPTTGNRATDRMMAGYQAMASYQGPQEDPWTRKALGA